MKHRNGFAVFIAGDGFEPVLVLEPRAAPRGSVVRVRRTVLGFGREFAIVVQAGLTCFCAVVATYAFIALAGYPRERLLLAVGLAWALAMGSFTGLRSVIDAVSARSAASRKLRDRLRTALFARAS